MRNRPTLATKIAKALVAPPAAVETKGVRGKRTANLAAPFTRSMEKTAETIYATIFWLGSVLLLRAPQTPHTDRPVDPGRSLAVELALDCANSQFCTAHCRLPCLRYATWAATLPVAQMAWPSGPPTNRQTITGPYAAGMSRINGENG